MMAMTTKKYKAIAFVAHMCAILLIACSLAFLIVSMKYRKLFLIEARLRLNYLTLQLIFNIHLILNIVMGLFGLVGIISKIGIFMSAFTFTCAISICFTAIYGVIIFMGYENNFETQRSALDEFESTARSIESLISTLFAEEGRKALETSLHGVMWAYYVLGTVSVALYGILMVCNLIGKRICNENDDASYIPAIKEANKVGLSSGSLRVRRVINASASPRDGINEFDSIPIEI